jgi:hypothetical protein
MILAIMLTTIVTYVAMIVFRGPIWLAAFLEMRQGHSSAWAKVTLPFAGAIGAALTEPLLMIAIVLFYYDFRIRAEGFDLQHMISSIDIPEPSSGVPAA